MEVIRLGEPVQISFELKPFDPPPVSLEEVEGVALLRIPTFDKETVQEVRDALGKNSGQDQGQAADRPAGRLLGRSRAGLRHGPSCSPPATWARSSGAPRSCRASAPTRSRSGRAGR